MRVFLNMGGRGKARVLAACVFLCAALSSAEAVPPLRTYQFWDTFDTVVTVSAFASKPVFDGFSHDFVDYMREYHALFDIYNNYDGVNNIKTVNDNAGIHPVEIDSRLMDMLTVSKELAELSGGSFNIALGPVLTLWHEAREKSLNDPQNAVIPGMDALTEASALCDIQKLILDRTSRTAYLTETGMSLDVGSIAKGYAVEQAARAASEKHGVYSYLVNAGGNVKTGAPPPDGREFWRIGLRNPDPAVFDTSGESVEIVNAARTSVVTSGDYQRYYMYNGERMGHIIDPETLLPAIRYRSVSVVGPDSGVCDALSTALFVLPEEKGRALAEQFGYSAFWMHGDGTITRNSDT